MKRLLLTGLVLGCATVWTVNAQDVQGRKGLTKEESNQREALIGKYDADGDGVLSKNEQKSLSKEDKKALARTGGVGTARKAPKDPAQKGEGELKQERRRDRDRASADSDQSKGSQNGKGSKGGGNGKGKGGKK